MSKWTKEEKDEAIGRLKARLTPGDTIYTTVHSVSSSGMSRQISLYITEKNEHVKNGMWICDITRLAARAIGGSLDRKNNEYLVMGGVGMDVCFEAVYCLGNALYPDGVPCAGEKWCRSNDHTNGSHDYSDHIHRDGGYAFRKESL